MLHHKQQFGVEHGQVYGSAAELAFYEVAKCWFVPLTDLAKRESAHQDAKQNWLSDGAPKPLQSRHRCPALVICTANEDRILDRSLKGHTREVSLHSRKQADLLTPTSFHLVPLPSESLWAPASLLWSRRDIKTNSHVRTTVNVPIQVISCIWNRRPHSTYYWYPSTKGEGFRALLSTRRTALLD